MTTFRPECEPVLWAALMLVLLSACARADYTRTAGPPGPAAGPGTAGQAAAANASPSPGGGQAARPAAREKGEPAAAARAEADMGDYEPIPLDRLVGAAQLIVAGEVTQVGETTFTLRPSQVLAGEASGPQVEVLQFTPSRFEGAPRPAPYKPGQEFLLFLFKDERPQAGGAWRVLGIGGEGEMPFEEGFVYFQGRSVEGLPAGTHRVHGAERRIQRFDARTFFEAVKGYRSCFEWKPGEGKQQPRPARLCDEAALGRYERASEIHRHLARLTTQRLGDR